MRSIIDEIEEYIPILYRIENADDAVRAEIRQDVGCRLIELEKTHDVIDADVLMKRISDKDIYVKVFIMSWLHHVTYDTLYIETMLEEVLASSLGPDERWHLYYQVLSLFFGNPNYTITERLEDLLDDLFKSVIDWYIERLDTSLEFIPSGERNKGFILVMTGQILMIQHGPTKTTLDRCQILMSDMGKEVLLINTGTALSGNKMVPVFDMRIGSYIHDFKEADYISYEDVDVPFWQMENRLPTLEETRQLIDIVRENKPYQIVSIGNGFLEEILCKMVPAVHISLSPSKMGRTYVQYQQIGRQINDEDRRFLKHRNLTERHVISDVFTSHLQTQFSHEGRQSLDLPEDVKLAVVVGGRLASEMTDDFLEMVKPCLEKGLYLLILGDISGKVDEFKSKLGEAGDKLITPGSVDDPLAWMEHCYLYINPHRLGGGTSSVEAMSKGVPPVSTRYGDVYTNVGDDFAVDDYDEMQKVIMRYLEDESFHSDQSEKAVKRANLMLDSSSAFIRVMNEFEKRMLEDER